MAKTKLGKKALGRKAHAMIAGANAVLAALGPSGAAQVAANAKNAGEAHKRRELATEAIGELDVLLHALYDYDDGDGEFEDLLAFKRGVLLRCNALKEVVAAYIYSPATGEPLGMDTADMRTTLYPGMT